VVYRPYTVLMTILLSGWMVAAYAKKKKTNKRGPSSGILQASLMAIPMKERKSSYTMQIIVVFIVNKIDDCC